MASATAYYNKSAVLIGFFLMYSTRDVSAPPFSDFSGEIEPETSGAHNHSKSLLFMFESPPHPWWIKPFWSVSLQSLLCLQPSWRLPSGLSPLKTHSGIPFDDFYSNVAPENINQLQWFAVYCQNCVSFFFTYQLKSCWQVSLATVT